MLQEIRENYRKLRGIEDYSAVVGTVIAGFALLMKKRTAAGSIWGLTNRGFCFRPYSFINRGSNAERVLTVSVSAAPTKAHRQLQLGEVCCFELEFLAREAPISYY